MFASKSEKKVHYSIRKFSIGVASVAVASLFMGSVVHATEKEGSTQAATSSNMAKTEHRKAAKQFDEYINKMIQLDRRKDTQNRTLIIKLSAIKTKYLRELNVLEEKSKDELPPKIKEELTAAFEQFKKDTLSTEPEKKVAEAKKKVEEAKKKAEDQKEKDRRNYPTITYKTLELEIAESDVEVKKAELELVKVKANEPRDEEKIKQAEAKVESKQAEATRLKKIKTDREQAEEEAKVKDEPKKRTKRGVLGEPATPDKKENDAKSSDSSVGEETLPSPSLKPEKKVAEAEKKVEEAKKKAEDQKEEDRRNYPTNTYKTLELEIAESDVEVKKAELELVK
ncbi:RICH domain-containing protein, partial [Streptococcus pneumoniae]|nr:RICH domain-containing protein [Streptococcus pneumoniae]MDS4957701.1 RICH domain-containing protein [Streptococcus pneumoniae]MDS5029351.1 RICH domain-containing protein [Streptococcus pneumoniae]MDS5518851.1 RICH domain-containing protein [Streptococcus pneumoniae]